MTQPVRYILQEPFFISSRLMPAVAVADATIHMQADTVDDDSHDPRVSWHYVIDGPGLHYEAGDVATAYRGQSTVASQLPTAMGTVLTYLAHVADGANRDPEAPALPDAVYQWARRNQDELFMTAELVEHGPPQQMPAAAAWRAITHDPYQTSYGRWCAGQATAHADRLGTLNPGGPATGLVVRDELWHETALAWYTTLTDRAEPAIQSVCAVADRDTIATWLTTAAPHPYAGTMADFLHPTHIDTDWGSVLGLDELVEHAQQAGLFGVPGHTIQLHNVFDIYTNQVGHLVTVQTPIGTTIASGPVDLRPANAHDACDMLRLCATYVDSALAEPADPAGDLAPVRARPFPNLNTTPPVQVDTPPPPTAAVRPHHHHR